METYFKHMTLLLGIVAVLVLPLPGLQAAEITVDTADDELNADGDCSLREAIEGANTDSVVDGCVEGSGKDTIKLPAGPSYVLTEAGAGDDTNATGDLDILDDLIIEGEGSATTIISGDSADRVLHVLMDVDLDISDVTIRDGMTDGQGAGLYNDGIGTVNLTDCVVTGNIAESFGGGLNNDDLGEMHITRCSITDNHTSVTGFGGGVTNDNDGTMTITESVISDNTSIRFGGGVNNNSGGTMTITDSTISNNDAERQGAGVNNNSDGMLTIWGSTINGNTAVQKGGGVHNNSSGSTTITNSTLSNNEAMDQGGGANNRAGGTLVIKSSTIVNNTSPDGAGLFASAAGATSVGNSIIANSTGDDCVDMGGFTSLGHNIDSDGTCGLAAGGDQPSTDPLVELLADNGGLTETHALLAASPAIDTGDDADCPATDQRSEDRPVDGDNDGDDSCDIGAYEAGTCGDGALDDGEECDDGNTEDGDGCDSECVDEVEEEEEEGAGGCSLQRGPTQKTPFAIVLMLFTGFLLSGARRKST